MQKAKETRRTAGKTKNATMQNNKKKGATAAAAGMSMEHSGLLQLPEGCTGSIISMLDSSDRLHLMETCRTAARHVMTAQQMLKKQQMRLVVSNKTSWLGFKQVQTTTHAELSLPLSSLQYKYSSPDQAGYNRVEQCYCCLQTCK
jgi:hypothetical protein